MAAKALLWLISVYKRFVSPFLPDSCKYYPTCSAYAAEAVNVHGAFLGAALAVWRVLRCNPFSQGGYDPVPAKGDISGRNNRAATIKR